ncbi:trophoblast glycoprotein-like [Oncorhynchus mykiss]|uniref:trophoblast glycoprotein-like n=1 Tax=Oncorhynchus mykiss TaxID=8022 RepID=UPI001878B25B|nr:trophoblast glycoprotein-like [Oncorhynchus mykiss]
MYYFGDVLRGVLSFLKGRCFCLLAEAVFVCLLFSSVKAEEECPLSCICVRDSGTVTCRDTEHTELPGDIPAWATTLILRGNNISTLPGGAFSTNNGTELELTTLSLSHNGIMVIEADAFTGLPRLNLLDLSHNPLVYISDRAFHGLRELRSLYLNDSLLAPAVAQLSNALQGTETLRNLHRLELSGNRLKTIPITRLDAFNLHTLVLTNNSIENIGKDNISSLYRHKRVRIYLSLNPFRCNCELESFYLWLKNSSQCVDAARLLCAEPDAKKGIPLERLRGEDVDCLNENLEAVSYVFLGIVMALIGIVFLMVLYLNRRGIKRWLNNIRDACRDQMEVYHYRYEQDSDPRLANVAV